MFNKIKHLKDLRSQAKELQNQLSSETANGEAAFGKVKITIDGNQKVIDIKIDSELLTNREKLQDALKDAFNDAIKKIQHIIAMKMRDQGIGLPGM